MFTLALKSFSIRQLKIFGESHTQTVFASILMLAMPTVFAFDFNDVLQKAQKLAQQPFDDGHEKVPEALRKLEFAKWAMISPVPEKALWAKENLPFRVEFFHPGMQFSQPVSVSVIDGDQVVPIHFSKDYFDYGQSGVRDLVPDDVGFAGFRLRTPLHQPNQPDEVLSFIGASYFRVLGKDQHYGLSARGVAINTGMPPKPEEFPYFKSFWLEKPKPDTKSMKIYALLNGESLTGAYAFQFTPGKDALMLVKAVLLPRKPIEKLGLAPLTSMFVHGENMPVARAKVTAEVHDSDGILIHHSSGEWLWRPLMNPKALLINRFTDKNLLGFGLLQRDRDPNHYQDPHYEYHKRPSLWIEPQGSWGNGSVELVHIPSDSDFNDNIVAYWVPEEKPVPGKPIQIAYKQRWFLDDASLPPTGQIRATTVHKTAQRTEMLIDFARGNLDQVSENALEASVQVGQGAKVLARRLDKIADFWRLTLFIEKESQDPVEMRAYLKHKGKMDAVTETFSYVLAD